MIWPHVHRGMGFFCVWWTGQIFIGKYLAASDIFAGYYRPQNRMNDNHKKLYLLLFILALAVNFAGIAQKFFTDDPGLYAAISKNLIYRHSFFELFTYNRDWLDKPHFPFWAVLLSFKVFGISEWAYRLPALLFFMLSVLYTWLLTKKFYSKETAAIAVLILMTALNTMLSNTDVRAEPYLMGLITGAIYHVARLDERFSLKHLLLAALLTGFAIMTKGIFVTVAVCGALLGQLIFQKRFKSLFRLRWLWLILLTIIFTLPELYALYVQFDIHPEKTVFGRQHVSGIKWFLWDSQFGRFVNTGPIIRKTPGSVFFYVHTLLWAFAPWCLLFYCSIFKKLKAIFKGKASPEYFTLSGGLLLVLLFSVSKFQLPFYTNAVFPLFAVVTAPDILDGFGAKFRLIVEWLFIILLPVATFTLNFLWKPVNGSMLIADIFLFAVVAYLIFVKVKERDTRTFMLTCLSALFAGFYTITVFYNEIVPYKGQIAAAQYINQPQFNNTHLYALTAENNLFQFYYNGPMDLLPIEQFKDFKADSTSVFYVNQLSMDYLLQTHADFKVLRSFANYPRETLLPAFINKATRYKTLDRVYLVTKN